MKKDSFPQAEKESFRWKKVSFYFFIAIQFLTTIPLPVKRKDKLKSSDIAHSTIFFPLAGLIIGILLFLIYLISGSYLSPGTTSAFILAGWVLTTGALHIDGLADTIDGLSGGGTKKETLRIMKDAHTGAKGTAGIVVLLVIKLFLLIHIISSSSPQILIYTPVLGRWGMIVGCYSVPYAREEGMGKFSLLLEPYHLIGATSITIFLGIFLLGPFFLIPLGGVGAFSLLFSFYLKRKIGGFTGDTLGALNEVGEAVALLTGPFS